MRLKSKIHDYTVNFHNTSDFITGLADTPEALFIVDKKVWNHHRDGCLNPLHNKDIILLVVNERRKTLRGAENLYKRIMERSLKRNATIISFGGGITQDITGFVASTIYRGFQWIYVPTTLLAQTDSCIGAKTSLNFMKFKNLLGTFYPPVEIHVHTPFIKTQSSSDFFSGVGESVKLHIIGGETDTNNLKNSLSSIVRRDADALLKTIRRSLHIKQSYIESDEFDTGRRNMLNYGHCFGHALETVNQFKVPHGQAIVMGMTIANIVAEKRGILSTSMERYFAKEILEPVMRINIELMNFDAQKLLEAMRHDKKRVGRLLPLVMVGNGYEMIKVNDLTDVEVVNALSKFSGRFVK